MGHLNKSQRLLELYDRLLRGEVLSNEGIAQEYGISPKSAQRYMSDLKDYLSDRGDGTSVAYDRRRKGYVLREGGKGRLSEQEILALAKILLESRALEPGELSQVLHHLLAACPQEGRSVVEDIIKNEAFHYVPLRHGKKLLKLLWDVSICIRNHEILHIQYNRADGKYREYDVKPVSILFSEFYFYLLAYQIDAEWTYPTFFRFDRLRKGAGTGKHFSVPYQDRFQDGEFRKRVPFMYAGPLETVRFQYQGPNLDYVLDRLPTAEILSREEGTYMISAEVYGDGIRRWLAGLGKQVTMLS